MAYFKVVMHSCELFGTYSRDHERKRDFQKNFPWEIFEKIFLPLCKFSNRMMTSGLNNGRSEIGIVNMSTLP